MIVPRNRHWLTTVYVLAWKLADYMAEKDKNCRRGKK